MAPHSSAENTGTIIILATDIVIDRWSLLYNGEALTYTGDTRECAHYRLLRAPSLGRYSVLGSEYQSDASPDTAAPP